LRDRPRRRDEFTAAYVAEGSEVSVRCRRGQSSGRRPSRKARVASNDHSVFGYFLRLTLLGRMFPMSFGGEAVYALVDVHALGAR